MIAGEVIACRYTKKFSSETSFLQEAMQYPIVYSWDDGLEDKGMKFRVARNSYLQIMRGNPGFDNGAGEYTISCECPNRIFERIYNVREVQILESNDDNETLRFLDPANNLFNITMKTNKNGHIFNSHEDSAQDMATVLHTKDLCRMRTFYEKTIGLRPTIENQKKVVYQIPETSATLEVTSCSPLVEAGKAMLQFMSRNVDDFYEVIRDQGMTKFYEHIHSTDYGKRAYTVFDPDYNVIVLFKFI